MLDKNLQQSIRFYQAFQVFISLLFWVPIFYLYQTTKGLTDPEYFQIQSLYYWFFCFLELPTGYFSDRWGHRKTLILSAIIMCATNLLSIFSDNYWMFLTHFFFIAVARSLMSGAASAYLYDLLKSHQIEKSYKQIEGKAKSLSLIVRIAAWSASGFLYSYNMNLPYWLSALAAAIAIYCAIKFPKRDSLHINKNPMAILKTQVLNNVKILWLMLLGACVFMLLRLTKVNLYQPILKLKGFNASSFGLVMGFMTAFEAIGSYQSYRLHKWFTDINAVFIMTIFSAISVFFISISSSFYIPTLLSIFSLFAGVASPLIGQLINDAIKDGRFRATIISIEAMIHRAVTGTAALTAAYFTSGEEMFTFLQYLSFATVIFVFFIILGVKHNNFTS